VSNPVAVPGTNVPSGSGVSPGGAQGVAGVAGYAYSVTASSPFTVPAVGQTVVVTVADASWVTAGQVVNVAGAAGSGIAGSFQVQSVNGNQLTLLNPTPAPAIPLADSTQPGLLNQLSGNTTDFVDGTNNCQNLASANQSTIWAVRLRSFNSVQNCNFEVTQRNCHVSVVNPASGILVEDRWSAGNTALNPTFQGVNVAGSPGGGVMVPGTSFVITTGSMRVTIGTSKASLAAGDHLDLGQTIEGPNFRELMSDVHSISLLVRSSVANLKFGIALREPTSINHSLTKLCTLGAANTVTLIQLSNLPIWPSAGTFTTGVGSAGYILTICLAAGSTFMSPANDTWQTAGNVFGAPGQDNFLANTVGSTFEVFFVQHQPGPYCETLIDKPWSQNYDECLRYYSKCTNYAAKFPDGLMQYNAGVIVGGTTSAYCNITFPKPMAKAPTVTVTNNTATTGVVYIPGWTGSVGASSIATNERGVQTMVLAAAQGAAGQTPALACGWQADTGW
jgi:hypothetical protein